VNEVSIPNLVYVLVTCIYVFMQLISAIVKKMASFKRCNFTSISVNNLSLQKNRSMV